MVGVPHSGTAKEPIMHENQLLTILQTNYVPIHQYDQQQC